MLIIFFIVLVIVFLIYNNLKINKTFLIKKGTHYSNFLFKIYFLFNERTFKYRVNFVSDFRYDIGAEQADVNKLIGIGFLPGHHVDSIRFGYRYNPSKDRVEILAYSYVNKTRIIKEEEVLVNCLMNNNYTLSLQITKTEYRLTVIKDFETIPTTISVIEKTHNKKIGYLLKPYFGGNTVAPKDFKIKITSL